MDELTDSQQRPILIVRVKRQREDLPAETIRIYDQTNQMQDGVKRKKYVDDLAKNFEYLGQDREKSGNINRNFLLLQRVSTLDTYSRSSLDIDSAAAAMNTNKVSNFEDDVKADQVPAVKRSKVIVTQSSKAVNLSDVMDHSSAGKGTVDSIAKPSNTQCIFIDTIQVFDSFEQQQTNLEAQKQYPNTSIAKTKILDPATRLLASGIPIAKQKGDFSNISAGLIKGADPNHQLPEDKGGLTSLMVAAERANLRMVKRLLQRDVDPLLQNSDGMAAIDLIRETSNTREDCLEIRILLQSAMVKAHQQRAMEQRRAYAPGFSASREPLSNADFVVDVYRVVSNQDPSVADYQSDIDAATAIVQVEGLRIGEDGSVELLSYDSDWSDLADDEDPDSNDERYAGNDYPDESDDEGQELFGDANEDGSYSEHDSDSDDNVDGIREFRSKSVHAASEAFKGSKVRWLNEERALDDEIRDFFGAGLGGREGGDNSIFDRAGNVGRVLKAVEMDDDAEVDVMGSRSAPSAEALRTLWGEDSASRNNHEQRVNDMQARTGMLFASNPKEFNSSGIPKYGEDLSDYEVECYEGYGHSGHGAMLTEAYDSELDQSEED